MKPPETKAERTARTRPSKPVTVEHERKKDAAFTAGWEGSPVLMLEADDGTIEMHPMETAEAAGQAMADRLRCRVTAFDPLDDTQVAVFNP